MTFDQKNQSKEFDGSDIIPSYEMVISGPTTLNLSAIPLRGTKQSVIAFKFSVTLDGVILN